MSRQLGTHISDDRAKYEAAIEIFRLLNSCKQYDEKQGPISEENDIKGTMTIRQRLLALSQKGGYSLPSLKDQVPDTYEKFKDCIDEVHNIILKERAILFVSWRFEEILKLPVMKDV